MKPKTLYQTLEDRGNIDHVEAHGPFFCDWRNAWLGNGYYFWDTFIDNGHWWGDLRYIKTGRSYLICRGKCDFSADHCFDLVGEPEHLQVLDESIEMMRSQNLVNDRTTVSKVFEFIKQKVGNFPYQAIRAFGILSQSDTREDMAKYRRTIIFEYGKYQYLDYRPAIQICLLKKTSLGFRDYCVVYPDEYNIDYVI